MPRLAIAGIVLCALAALAARPSASAAELLSNGGFESGVSPWSATHGQLDAVSSPVRSGGAAARLSSSALQSHEVSSWVNVAPGQSYQFSGWALLDDPSVDRIFLRVSWFNGSGGLISQADSAWLTIAGTAYQFLTTGAITSPLAAASARVGVRVQASGSFNVYIDDFSLSGAIPPPPTQPPPPPTATVPPPPPTAAPTPTPKPQTATPKPTKSPKPATPTKTPATAGEDPVEDEPDVFNVLTNGGFEIVRGDGTPYAWKDIGAELAVSESAPLEGTRALAMTSRSGSTKWAYQTVPVAGGAYYAASGYTWNAGAEETFLRVSWYASDDGSGAALDSVDSTFGVAQGNGFARLETGPVQSPPEARTAKVRLMVRPGSESSVTVYFDVISFGPTSARPDAAAAEAAAAPRGRPVIRAEDQTWVGGVAPDDMSGEAIAERMGLGFANVRPGPTQPPRSAAAGGAGYDWLAVLAIGVGFGAIAFVGATEWSRRRSVAPDDDG